MRAHAARLSGFPADGRPSYDKSGCPCWHCCKARKKPPTAFWRIFGYRIGRRPFLLPWDVLRGHVRW